MKAVANNIPSPDGWDLLHSLPQAVLLIDAGLQVSEVNDAAEQLLGISRRQLCTQPLPPALSALAAQSYESGRLHRRDSMLIPRPSLPDLRLRAQSCPVFDADLPSPIAVVLLLEPAVSATTPSADTASVMAAMLAHEIKNPLSGIRGAAQLLGKKLSDAERPLSDLICREVDRITALLQKMEFFSNAPAVCDDAVNIHEVLETVRASAQSGFASRITIDTRYDPSLPAVRGHHDLLVQLFMNLVKNAAEALEGKTDGRIILSTRYRLNHTQQQADGSRRSLPIAIAVEDNAGGVQGTIRNNLFKPFVTTKINGTGLGLAVAARITADHGGDIALDDAPDTTRFTVRLAAF